MTQAGSIKASLLPSSRRCREEMARWAVEKPCHCVHLSSTLTSHHLGGCAQVSRQVHSLLDRELETPVAILPSSLPARRFEGVARDVGGKLEKLTFILLSLPPHFPHFPLSSRSLSFRHPWLEQTLPSSRWVRCRLNQNSRRKHLGMQKKWTRTACQPASQAGRWTEKQADKQTGKYIGRQTSRQAGSEHCR